MATAKGDLGEIGSLLRETSEQFEEAGKRVESMLDAARVKFEKDFSATTAAAGLVLAGVSISLAFLDKSPVVIGVGLVGGVALVLGAALLRWRTGESQVTHARTLIELEKERARFSQQSAVLRHVWLFGLPEGVSLAALQGLIGTALPSADAAAPAQPRALSESSHVGTLEGPTCAGD